MALTDPEVRVLAALIEKEAAVPESYPLTLNALRLACNQSTNRRPVVAYDDRTVEAALLALKSVGLVRFVHPSHGGRTTRYRQTADERWRLRAGELLVLSALALRGDQTVAEIRSRIERLLPADESSTIEEMLDCLAARSPEPLAVRSGRRSGERDDRWAAAIGSVATDDDVIPHNDVARRTSTRPVRSVSSNRRGATTHCAHGSTSWSRRSPRWRRGSIGSSSSPRLPGSAESLVRRRRSPAPGPPATRSLRGRRARLRRGRDRGRRRLVRSIHLLGKNCVRP